MNYLLAILLSTLSNVETAAAAQACQATAYSFGMLPDENPIIRGRWTCVMHDLDGYYYSVPMWEPVTFELTAEQAGMLYL